MTSPRATMASTTSHDTAASTSPENSSQNTATNKAKTMPKSETLAARLPSLPREILREIVKQSMVAQGGGKLNMTIMNNAPFRPGINLACLHLDRDLYHSARHSLYSNNEFIFKDDGYEVRTITNSVGLLKCRLENCAFGSIPVLANATFELGCMVDASRSELRLKSFGKALKSLKRPVCVETLTIHLQHYAWRMQGQLRVFLEALRNVRVSKSFILKGLDVHLEFNLRAIAWIMGMDMQPIKSSVHFRGKESNALGHFETVYRKHASGKQPGPTDYVVPKWHPLQFNDPTAEYHQWLETAHHEMILNGLDYISDFEPRS